MVQNWEVESSRLTDSHCQWQWEERPEAIAYGSPRNYFQRPLLRWSWDPWFEYCRKEFQKESVLSKENKIFVTNISKCSWWYFILDNMEFFFKFFCVVSLLSHQLQIMAYMNDHGCCEFMCETAMLQDSVSQHPLPPAVLAVFLPPLCRSSLSLGGDRADVSSVTVSTHIITLCAVWTAWCPCINHYLLHCSKKFLWPRLEQHKSVNINKNI